MQHHYLRSTSPVNAGQLKQQTGQDPVLAKVMDFTLTGWPLTPPPELTKGLKSP